MENREVIFVSNVLANGGAARVLTVLANRFAAQGQRIGIFSYRPHADEYPVGFDVAKAYGPQGAGLMVRLRRLYAIRRYAKRNPGATVVAFEYFVNMEVVVACLGLGNRVLVSERNDPARVGSGFPTDLIRKLLYRKADALVCQTAEAAAHFSNRIRKVVILNPVKADLPAPVEGERRKTVVTFSRLESQKNLAMLVRAFAAFRTHHPEYTLEIYGDGSERDVLLALAKSLSLADSLKISPARSDVHDLVRDCAMFALPSDYEGLSNSMIEAMALGLPTICTDCPCGGARMLIKHEENGLLVPVGDVDALTRAMTWVADDADRANAIGNAASSLRERLSLQAVASEWSKVIEG